VKEQYQETWQRKWGFSKLEFHPLLLVAVFGFTGLILGQVYFDMALLFLFWTVMYFIIDVLLIIGRTFLAGYKEMKKDTEI